MRVQLRIRVAEGREYSWEYRGPEFVVGRGPGCALQFDAAVAAVVSWEHARIAIGPEGASIVDAGSSNGTFVNGRRIQEKTPLKLGDLVTLGKTGPVLEITAVELAESLSPSPPAEPRRPAARLGGRPPISVTPAGPFGERPDGVNPAAGKAAIRRPVSDAPSQPQRVGGALPSTVFRLLTRLQRGQRLGYLLAAGIAACLVAGVLIVAVALPRGGATARSQPGNEGGDPGKDVGKQVFSRLIHSVVCIVKTVDAKASDIRIGSGALVDQERRLILTNAHVASEGALSVYFPQWQDGKLMTDLKHYATHGKPYPARVLRTVPTCDLALLQLDALPADAVPLALAEASASPGDQVHSVGNPSASGALWTYSSGTVRQVCRQKHVTVQGNPIDAQIVITQVPINAGDSGSAVVNNHGQLVAVNYCGVLGSEIRDITYAIDISEVRALLGTLPP